MNAQLYERLNTRIGKDGANAARRNWYAIMAFIAVSIADLLVWFLGPIPSHLEESAGIALMMVAAGAWVATSMLLAKRIASHLNARVAWYQIPGYYPQDKFEKWLDETKKTGSSDNSIIRHNQ